MPKVRITLAILGLVSALTAVDASARRRPKRKQPSVDVHAAVEKLASPDPKVSTKAARALGKAGSRQALDALLDGLALGLHPNAAAAALDSLAAHASVRSLDTVFYYLHYRNAKVRAAAVRAAGSLDDSRAVAAVLDALHDGHKSVRAAAAKVIARRKLRRGVEPLMALLQKGDEAAAPALAAMADPDLAGAVAELIGTAPDGLVARCLGAILRRADFGPETARVEVVRALGKVPGAEAVEELTNYIESIPEKPPRQSRREAEAIIENRLTGGS